MALGRDNPVVQVPAGLYFAGPGEDIHEWHGALDFPVLDDYFVVFGHADPDTGQLRLGNGSLSDAEVAARIAADPRRKGRPVLFMVCYFLDGADRVLAHLGPEATGVATDGMIWEQESGISAQAP